jgi:uncharacterized protein
MHRLSRAGPAAWKSRFTCSRGSSFEDPRFPPLKREELDAISIQVSVLSLPERIDCPPDSYPEKIIIGKHGLIIRQGYSQGLLLPQVATEYGWDQKEFLAHLCIKAGLGKDAWKRDCELYSFQAQIFTEEDGKVIEACQPLQSR